MQEQLEKIDSYLRGSLVVRSEILLRQHGVPVSSQTGIVSCWSDLQPYFGERTMTEHVLSVTIRFPDGAAGGYRTVTIEDWPGEGIVTVYFLVYKNHISQKSTKILPSN